MPGAGRRRAEPGLKGRCGRRPVTGSSEHSVDEGAEEDAQRRSLVSETPRRHQAGSGHAAQPGLRRHEVGGLVQGSEDVGAWGVHVGTAAPRVMGAGGEHKVPNIPRGAARVFEQQSRCLSLEAEAAVAVEGKLQDASLVHFGDEPRARSRTSLAENPAAYGGAAGDSGDAGGEGAAAAAATGAIMARGAPAIADEGGEEPGDKGGEANVGGGMEAGGGATGRAEANAAIATEPAL